MPETILNAGSKNEIRANVPDGYRLSLRDAAKLVSDLDRSAAGRWRGDVESQDPSGVSQGNPVLPPGTHVGFDISGRRLVVPENVRDIAAWTASESPEDTDA